MIHGSDIHAEMRCHRLFNERVILSLSNVFRSSSRSLCSYLFLLTLVSFTGCGASDAPPEEKLTPVTGTVKLGDQPAAGVRIMFTPVGSTTGGGAFALTDESGKYEVTSNRTQKPGIIAGEYSVQFSKFVKADGSPIPPNTSPFAAGGRESIPPLWSEPGRAAAHNTVTIPEGGRTIDFTIPLQ